MFLTPGCKSLFLVTFQEFAIIGSEEACDGVCFYLKAATETVFDNSSCFYITGSEGVCGGVCF